MKTCLRAYMMTALFACLLVTGCSEKSNPHLDEMKKQLDVEVGVVEKVSILSTDGQEFPIELPAFSSQLMEQGKELTQSEEPIKKEDVRYTIILYRQVEAPMVIEVGTHASQIANKTYRGNGAERLYRWIRDITGQSLFLANLQHVDLNAVDLNQSLTLSERQTYELGQLLRTAKHVDSAEAKQYPLYPHYRLKLDAGDKVLDATVLTPTLLSVKVGAEIHYFHVNSELFSALTEWLPLREKSPDPFDSLFKASEIRIVPIGDKKVSLLQSTTADNTVDQAMVHELVRILKQGTPAKRDLSLPKQEKYKLIFVVNGQDKEIRLYDGYFVMNGQNYLHHQLDKKILVLVDSLKK